MIVQTVVRQGTWVSVCQLDQLRVDVGAAALVEGVQVALFRLDQQEVRAVGIVLVPMAFDSHRRGSTGRSPGKPQLGELRHGRCL